MSYGEGAITHQLLSWAKQTHLGEANLLAIRFNNLSVWVPAPENMA